MGRLFGKDGIKGIAVTELTCELAMQIGRAAAEVLAGNETDPRPLLIGKDTRSSADTIEAALCAGICSAGVDAELLGIVPAPAVAYLAKAHEAASADAKAYKEASKEASKENGLMHNAKEYFITEDKKKSLGEYLIFDKKDFTDTVTSPKNAAIFYGGKATDNVITGTVKDNIKEHINNNGSNSPSSTDEEQIEEDFNKYL